MISLLLNLDGCSRHPRTLFKPFYYIGSEWDTITPEHKQVYHSFHSLYKFHHVHQLLDLLMKCFTFAISAHVQRCLIYIASFGMDCAYAQSNSSRHLRFHTLGLEGCRSNMNVSQQLLWMPVSSYWVHYSTPTSHCIHVCASNQPVSLIH